MVGVVCGAGGKLTSKRGKRLLRPATSRNRKYVADNMIVAFDT